MESVTAAGLSRMTEEELNALPYGAIRLSPYGTVLSYNATEGHLTGRVPARVLGRNFFLDVAPCTDVQEFRGRFIELAKDSGVSIFHEFSFEFPFEKPLRVKITLLRDRGDKSIWVLVEPQVEVFDG
jgi:photoactive yellow protein